LLGVVLIKRGVICMACGGIELKQGLVPIYCDVSGICFWMDPNTGEKHAISNLVISEPLEMGLDAVRRELDKFPNCGLAGWGRPEIATGWIRTGGSSPSRVTLHKDDEYKSWYTRHAGYLKLVKADIYKEYQRIELSAKQLAAGYPDTGMALSTFIHRQLLKLRNQKAKVKFIARTYAKLDGVDDKELIKSPYLHDHVMDCIKAIKKSQKWYY
jgi:hypothetical protein